MAKRIKTVFNNSQCAHVWASQSQSNGRSGSMFFEGTDIYSYGRHYLAARIHTVKGKKIALVNSKPYSPTTSQHLGHIQDALNGLMPYSLASDVTNLTKAVTELDAKAKESIKTALKRMKIASKDSIKWEFEWIKQAFENASQLRKILGRKAIFASKADLVKVQKHLDARLKRYNELNTPEMIAIKAEKLAKKLELAAAKEIEVQAENIEKFKNGEHASLYNLPYEFLRIKGDQVETSRGANVPVKQAIALYKAIEAGHGEGLILSGTKVGSFQLMDIYPIENDTVVKIGCHKILLSEAKRVLKAA